MRKFSLLLVFTVFYSVGCAPIPAAHAAIVPLTATVTPTVATLTVVPTPSVTATPQARQTLTALGPELEQFPASFNPLTGQRVSDPAMLGLPAVLVSISNMPPTARPQAGTSFAAWVFELFIGTGTTRFMGVFYGDLPRRIPNASGGCAVRSEISQPGAN